MINLNKLEKQIRLEEEMRGLGVMKYRREVEKAKASGQETTTAYGMNLLSQAIEPTANKIAEVVKENGKKPSQKRGIAYPILKQLTPEVLAFLTIKCTLDTISLEKPFLQACIAISKAVEDELIHRKFMRDHRQLFRSMKKSFRARNSGEVYQKYVTKLIARRKGVELDEFNTNLRVNLGTVLIDCMIEATGLVAMKQQFSRGKPETYLVPCEKTIEWINGKNAFCEVMSPSYLPCIVPPKPWSNIYDGGFYTDITRTRLVKTRDKNYLRKLEEADMPEVYDAVNTIQNTSWKINPKIYAVLRQMVETEATLGLLPRAGEVDLPPKPQDMATNEASKKAWKAEAREAYNLHAKNVSKRMALMKQLWVAEKFKDEEEIFFIYTLDFRGRAYPVQLFLHPQGDDVSRSLLTFATAKPVGNDGACWLAIHGANQFGFDKASLQDRIDWTVENQEKILASAKDPFSNRWWTEADNPFLFLAFCFEWQGYVEQGESYESSLPVSMDGSCNGLQNFSAMLRDEVGGAAVNLVPSSTPNDVYGLVASKVSAIVDKDPDERAVWWRGRVTRSICKRPVMTLPYGVTKIGMVEQILEELVKKRDKGEISATYGELNSYSHYLGRIVYEVIGETLIAARQAMDWLRYVAEVLTAENKVIEWKAPNGFPVLQAYYKQSLARVPVKSSSIKLRPAVKKYTPNLDIKQQKNGIAPNFVHSMDAAHMMKTVLLSSSNGVTHYCMVHDSFGSHAADAQVLGAALRQAFVEMYRSYDVLQQSYDFWGASIGGEPKVQIPMPPSKGSLNLDLILESEFFFA